MVYGMSLDAVRIDETVVNEVIRDQQEHGVFTPESERPGGEETADASSV